MKKLATLISVLLPVSEISMAQNAVIPFPRPLPPRLVVQQGATEPMQLQELKINAAVRGLYATVETEMVFMNPNKGSQLEGELEFPLPDRATVCGYALDINGVLVDGVVVPKEQARVAFETETRRNVDPGLVEHVKGNVYRTRIYPLPAGGTRSIKLVYTTPLATAPNGDAALWLPMPREKIGKREVKVEVADLNGQPPQIGGLGDTRFSKAESFWRVASTDGDVTPGDDVMVAMPKLPDDFALLEKDSDGTVWFNAWTIAPTVKRAPQVPKALDVLWDASGSRNGESLALDLAFVAALPKEISKFRLTVFRDQPEAVREFDSAEKLVEALKSVVYDGATDFDTLLKALPEQTEYRLMFTDGLDTMSGETPDFNGKKITAVISSPVGDREGLRQACFGAVIDLQTTAVPDAVNTAFCMPVRLDNVSGKGIADVQGLGQLAQGRVSVLGRLTAAETEIDFHLGVKNKVTLKSADARDGRVLATAWASARVSQLAPHAEDFADDLLALGREYGVVSPVTSLLVLETLDQWLRHKIEPPASQPELREQWRAAMKQRGTTDADKLARHLKQLEEHWKAHLAWWERDYDKNPLPKPVSDKPGLARRMMNAVRDAVVGDEGRMEAAAPADGAAVMMEVQEAEPTRGPNRMMAARAPGGAQKAKSPENAGRTAAIEIKAWSPDTPYLKQLKAAAASDAYAVYASQRAEWAKSPAFYLDCAGYFFASGDTATGVRVISNLSEMKIEDSALLRVLAWRLREAKAYDRAVMIFRRVAKLRGEEGQSFRDLAVTLMERGKQNRSKADLEEAMRLLVKVAMTPWNRHADILPIFALEELNALVAWIDAQDWKDGEKPVVPEYDEKFRQKIDTDVRIVMSWDADATDIDLHVIEPSKEEAFYGHNRTTKGGYVSRDITDGYGPEEYMIRKAPHGKYTVRAKYYGSRQQTVVGPATVTATVFTNWGRRDEQQRTMSLRLDKVKDMVDIGSILFGNAGDEPHTADDFKRLKAGMTQDEVRGLMGEPNGINGGEWTYLNGKRNFTLVFDGKNGKLLKAEERLPGGIVNVIVQ